MYEVFAVGGYVVGFLVAVVVVCFINWLRQRPARGQKDSSVAKYRVLLAVVISVAIYAVSSSSVLAQSPYPGGVRNPDEWYYCYAMMYNSDDNVTEPWGGMTCEHLLWQQLGGGGYESVLMTGGATVGGIVTSGGGQLANLRSWVMPPQGMKSFTYGCEVQVEACHTGGGSGGVGGSVDSNIGTGFSEDLSHWSVSVTPPTSGPACVRNDLLVVASSRALAYDSFWTVDVPTGWTTSGSTLGFYYEVNLSVTNENRTMDAEYECSIMSWESHPTWLSTNPPWLPDDGDLVIVPPTPAPTGTWDSVPWVPVTDTVNAPGFELGDPQTEVCTVVIPGYTWDWDSVTYGWDEVEICSTEYDLTLSVFGVDVGGYLVTAFLLAGVGVLVSIIKRA